MLPIESHSMNFRSITPPLILLFHQKFRSLNSINHHKIFPGLRHRFISRSLLFQKLMETFHLFILVKHIANIRYFQLGNFSYLFLIITVNTLLSAFFIFIQRAAYLVLILKHFEFNVITHESHLER